MDDRIIKKTNTIIKKPMNGRDANPRKKKDPNPSASNIRYAMKKIPPIVKLPATVSPHVLLNSDADFFIASIGVMFSKIIIGSTKKVSNDQAIPSNEITICANILSFALSDKILKIKPTVAAINAQVRMFAMCFAAPFNPSFTVGSPPDNLMLAHITRPELKNITMK